MPGNYNLSSELTKRMHDINQFSKREKEVANLLLQGKSNKQIAITLGVSAGTVEYHLKNIYKKLQVSSRTEAVLELGKSVGDDISSVLGKSVVEINGKAGENDGKSISTWRFPMNKKFYIIGGGLLAIGLVVAMVFANMPARNINITSTPEVNATYTERVMPTVAQNDFAPSDPTIIDTSPLPFEYTVVSGDTCESIAAAFNVSVEVLMGMNHMPSCPLSDGQILLIPNPNAQPSNDTTSTIPTEFYGEWKNANLKNPDITRVAIQSEDGRIYINMFGACQPTDCNWLEFSPTPTVIYNYDSMTGILNVRWTFDFIQTTQELTLTPDGQLKVMTKGHYLDNSGRTDYETVEYFIK